MKLSIIAVLLFISGCATFSKDECKNMDWSRAGYLSALEGKGKSHGMKYYNRSCFQEYGIAPDPDMFSAGHERGIKDFCAPENAYHFGARGEAYHNTCPKELNEAFLNSYTKGLSQYNSKKIRELKRENEDLRYEVDELKDKIDDLEDENSDLKSGIR